MTTKPKKFKLIQKRALEFIWHNPTSEVDTYEVAERAMEYWETNLPDLSHERKCRVNILDYNEETRLDIEFVENSESLEVLGE